MADPIKYILSPGLQEKILFLKIAFIIISLFFLLGILLLALRSTWLRWRVLHDIVEVFTYRPLGAKKLAKQFARTKKRLESGRESEYKLALIEADNMLDEFLKRMGYGGEILGDRLKQLTPTTMPNIEQLWEVHKIRNNVVHDPDYRLSLEQAQKTLGVYERSLQKLEAL